MKISILTLFPNMFKGPFDYSILKRAQEKNLVTIEYINIRDFGIGDHQMVDDTPYGGGTGMVLRVDVIDQAIQHTRCSETSGCREQVLLMDARGETFTQQKAKTLSTYDHLILIAGHYEGFDERVLSLIDQAISIGDFVLTGGELPAMVITDTVARLVQGVIKDEATAIESFSQEEPLLEYPQYTKPRTYKDYSVPEVLLSGDHGKIAEWRSKMAKEHTKKRRPDLLK